MLTRLVSLQICVVHTPSQFDCDYAIMHTVPPLTQLTLQGGQKFKATSDPQYLQPSGNVYMHGTVPSTLVQGLELGNTVIAHRLVNAERADKVFGGDWLTI